MRDIDLTWWFDFILSKLPHVRLATRNLVRILDFRHFAKESHHFATDQSVVLAQSLHLALNLLPNTNCILLDQHSELDSASIEALGKSQAHPLLLSLSGCTIPLSNAFYRAQSLKKIVYLDISGIPGSIRQLVDADILPDLRILKIRDKEADDATVGALVDLYRHRLWSLDLTQNKLTDSIIPKIVQRCFPDANSLRSDAFFRVEGKLLITKQGTSEYGQFVSIHESAWSGNFNHPERYFMDAPMYHPEASSGHSHGRLLFRSNYYIPKKLDSIDVATDVLSCQSVGYDEENMFRISRGITHISVSHNAVSAVGVERLLRDSNGQIERLSCDGIPLLPATATALYSRFWPKSARLDGCIGCAYAFRPVLSSNLRSLQIHHSFVTHVPMLYLDGFSASERYYLAETLILQRINQAYPQPFVPDMNPRLTSITLTGVPRRSTGPLIERIITFLKLLSIQERDIYDAKKQAKSSSSWRQPDMLRGLRHLRLEFNPNPMDEETVSTTEDVDATELLNSGEIPFSFFDDERLTPPDTDIVAKCDEISEHRPATTGVQSQSIEKELDRDSQDFIKYDGQWNGENFTISVWTGTSTPHQNAIINDYHKLVIQQGVRDGIGPATPEQIIAGVPDNSFVFHTAWRIAIMPRQLVAPERAALTGMQDVLDALKVYRASGRAALTSLKKQSANSFVLPGRPHLFWTGQLEVLTQ